MPSCCASHVEGAVGVWTWWRSRPGGEERSQDLNLVEILLVQAGSTGPSTGARVQSREQIEPSGFEDKGVREEGTRAGGSGSR